MPSVVLRAHDNISLVLFGQGKYAEAATEARTAIALEEQFLEPDDPEFASSRPNLAIVLDVQGRHEEAEADRHSAIELAREALAASVTADGDVACGQIHGEVAAWFEEHDAESPPVGPQ